MTHYGTPAPVRDRIERDRELIRSQLAALLASMFGDRVDAPVAAHALLAVAEHFGRLVLEDEPPFDPERLVRAVRGLLGVLGSPT